MKLIQDGYGKDYHNNFLMREMPGSQRNRRRLQLLREFKTSGKLLEIGCGKAGFLRQAEQFFEVEGVDISPHAIAGLSGHFGERVRVANIEDQPLPLSRYDAVAAFNLLEHLRRPAEAIEKIYAALAQGGVALGSMPNNFGLIGGINTRLTNFFDRTHVSTYAPGRWRALFQQAGFAKIHLFGEVTFGRNLCAYLRGRLWPFFSFNLMFVCEKQEDLTANFTN